MHKTYKSYHTTCYITNLDHEVDECKLTCPKTCQNTIFTWLEHELPSSKSRHIIGAQTRGSYLYRVTVYPYNGCIRRTNPIVRHVMSLTWTIKSMLANWYAPKHAATQTLHDSNTRARWKWKWKRYNLQSTILPVYYFRLILNMYTKPIYTNIH